MVLSSVLVFLAFVYGGILLTYHYGWQAMPAWDLPKYFEPTLSVSVIIPARNEVDNILNCLRSILSGGYPVHLLEIIIIDDFSEDDTVRLLQQYIAKHPNEAIRLIQLSDMIPSVYRLSANKKRAIELAVAQAQGEIIVTTDADCLAPPEWLFFLTSRFGSDPQLAILTAPVVFHQEINLLQRFQSLDFLGMMGITAAGLQLGWHRMGNGANLAYRKVSFEAVGGYAGNERVASGDDMFLIQKMAAKWPGCVGFLKNERAVVRTKAMEHWNGFWQQRLRWGTKNTALTEWPIRLVLLAIWLFCMSIWVGIVVWTLGYLCWQVVVFQVIVKALSDWVLLREMCRYFKRKDLMRWFLPSFFIHTGYIALTGLGSLFFRQYEWKGRAVDV